MNSETLSETAVKPRWIESLVATNTLNGHVVKTRKETKNDTGPTRNEILTIPGIKIVKLF